MKILERHIKYTFYTVSKKNCANLFFAPCLSIFIEIGWFQ